jgi:ATP-dependent phosphoenolpyruvate carboxykinase
MRAFDLSQYDISVRNIFRNASPAKLYEEAIRHEPGTSISSTGSAYQTTAQKLAGLFVRNFAQYENGVSEAVRAAGPKTGTI